MRTTTIADVDRAIAKRNRLVREARVADRVKEMDKEIGLEPMDNGDSLADYYADRPGMFR